MLGLLKSKNNWTWAICGKHPAAKDYFQFKIETRLAAAFSAWVQNGYQRYVTGNKKAHGRSSWRFWSKGTKPGSLICGFLKDSSDSIGRPYPLLVIGSGNIKKWENSWAILFHAFKNLWEQIEYISSKRFDHLDQLEKEVYALKKPTEEWLDGIPVEPAASPEGQEFKKKVLELKDKRELWVSLDNFIDTDPYSAAEMWGDSIKRKGCQPPNALFIGGIPERHYMAMFHRSLNVSDFVRLWSLSEGGEL